MKKLLLITAMFMAMNTWSADYKLCHAIDTKSLERCVLSFLNAGYEPFGSLAIQAAGTFPGKYIQPMYRR